MFRTHPRVKEFVGSCMKKEVIELSRPGLFVSNVELGFKFARIILIIHIILIIIITRPKPAYGRQGLDWIVGPGYSFVVFSTVGQSDHFS